MVQRDYILRMIEQLGSMLIELRRRILGQRADPTAIQDDLGEVAGRAGVDLELLRGFSVDTLHMFVAPTGEIEPARCWLMAEVLYLDGLQSHVQGNTEAARASLDKARVLFTLLEPRGGMLIGFPEAEERIAEIDELMEGAGAGESA